MSARPVRSSGLGVILRRSTAQACGEAVPLAAIGSVTISIGVATMPDHASDGTSLVRAADGALYLAKDRGRNRVEVATVPGSVSSGAGPPEMLIHTAV